METPPYQYQPLQHSDSLRILILHPSSKESDPIECTICHENLSDGSLDYEAVSYTWGNSGLTHVIHCNDAKQRLSVGENCHAALRRLRLPKKHRKLWVDAVCINQRDLSERGHQVRMMKDVYDFASGVMVMLSDKIPECRLLLDELAEYRDEVENLSESDDEFPRSAPSERIARQLETMFQDPWFKRVWVLQEVFAAKDIKLVYGSAIIMFSTLIDLSFGYGRIMVTRAFAPLPLRMKSFRQKQYSNIQFMLWHQLYEARDCLATDPKDKVFALKSLLGSGQSEMDHLIDYAQSVEECFKRVAEFLLPVLGLRLIVAARHPHGLDMASWIPDWSQTLPLHFYAFNYETFAFEAKDDVYSPTNIEYKKRALLSYVCKQSHSDATLHVIGCQYGRIVERSRVLRFLNIDDVERQMLQIYNRFENLRVDLDEESKIDDIETPGHFSGNIFDAMSLMDRVYLDYNLHRHSGVPVRMVIELRETVSNFYRALQDCSIASIENGELVIVPGAAQDGDVVCMIAGAVAPCLLRQCRDGCWMLVSGDCHIFGEEEPDIIVSDAYVDSHRSQVEEFILR